MKRIFSLLLVGAMCISLCACGGSNKKAFEASKAAYENIEIAYQIAEDFGSDTYEAWRVGIYDKAELTDEGVKHLISDLSLSEDEIRDGVAYAVLVEVFGEDWDATSDEDKETLRSGTGYLFEQFKDYMIEFCTMVVASAYKLNGKIDEAQSALNQAKIQMKELSENYSDYEYYQNLKEYYTTTSSFFDYCQDPTGNFEQCATTINDYKKEARDYRSDLDYIFEE